MTWTRPQRLEIRQLIGQGWSGDVYLAGDSDSSHELALRLISAEVVPQVGRLVQVLRPGAILGLPHVLPTTLPEESEGQLFYTMPFADAGSLRTLLNESAHGPATDALTALDLVRQIAEGLAASHVEGVVHGNLKPTNVLLCTREASYQTKSGVKQKGFEVYLSDFGLNTLRVPDVLSPYLSAEQRVGAPPTIQDDLYGVGAMLFELLTGQVAPLHAQASHLKDLPDPLRKLIGRCFGWPAPFIDVASFLGALRAAQRTIEVSLSHLGVHLSADTSHLQLMPGTPHSLQLRLAGRETAVTVVAEGWPTEWVKLPTAEVHLRPSTEVGCSVEFKVPRDPTALPKTYEVNLLVLDGDGEILARWPLHIEVLPFVAQTLEVVPSHKLAGRTATLETLLRNEGNQSSLYHLETKLPPGSRLRTGSAGQQFELAPGAEYRDILEVTLPLAFWNVRRHRISLVSHSRVPSGESWLPQKNSVRASAELLQRPLLPWWAAGLLLGGIAGATVWAAQPPRIETFALKGQVPVRGAPFTLSWRTQGARQVRLLEAPKVTLPVSGERQMPPLGSAQTYTLVAHGLLSQRSEQITVKPLMPAPSVVTFKVTPLRAKAGQSVTVQWNVENVSEVNLSPFGKVPPKGTRQLVVMRDTLLTLRAGDKGAQGVDTYLNIVVGAPQISLFKLSPAKVEQGQPVTVSWQVSGATQIRLAPLGDLPPSGTRTFVPSESGKLTLKASNGQQEVTSSAAVAVIQPAASIVNFSATPASPVIGQPLKLRWHTLGTRQVTLRWGNEQQVLPPSGEVSLTTTAQMQNLSLVAQGANGSPVLRSIHLQVRPSAGGVTLSQPAAKQVAQPPATPAPTVPEPDAAPLQAAPAPATVKVIEFYAQPLRVKVGQSVRLHWKVSGTKQVSLIGPDLRFLGRFEAQGTRTVRLGQPGKQTFRLVAGDEVARATVQVDMQSPGQTQPGPTEQAVPKKKSEPTVGVQKPAVVHRVIIRGFRASPSTVVRGQRTTLYWNVVGTRQVRISGLRGPNTNGSFPPLGQVRTAPVFSTLIYTLMAGPRRQSVSVAVSDAVNSENSGAANVPATPPIPATSGHASRPVPESKSLPAPPATPYAALAGNWVHPTGQLSLQIVGSRVTGNLTSVNPDLPGGSIRGTLTGEGSSPTLNAFVNNNGQQIAVLIHFDLKAQTFDGIYASRTSRVRWCGARTAARLTCP